MCSNKCIHFLLPFESWPEFLHPISSALIYRALTQSQRCLQDARARVSSDHKVLLVDKSTGTQGGEAKRLTPVQYVPFSRTVTFLQDLEGVLQSRKNPGTVCSFLLIWLITSAASSYHLFLKSDFVLFINYLI